MSTSTNIICIIARWIRIWAAQCKPFSAISIILTRCTSSFSIRSGVQVDFYHNSYHIVLLGLGDTQCGISTSYGELRERFLIAASSADFFNSVPTFYSIIIFVVIQLVFSYISIADECHSTFCHCSTSD
jgi:hypothetical protein